MAIFQQGKKYIKGVMYKDNIKQFMLERLKVELYIFNGRSVRSSKIVSTLLIYFSGEIFHQNKNP